MSEKAPTELEIIEVAVRELMATFDVERPPVPVELMLQRPRPGMWREVNLSELSLSFINFQQRHSPRMSVARLLARQICRCEWGTNRNLAQFANSDESIRMFARVIMMPRDMIAALSLDSRAAMAISNRFEVPEDDAWQRLKELGYPLKD